MTPLRPAIRLALTRACEAAYPREACGVVLGVDGQAGTQRVVVLRNLASGTDTFEADRIQTYRVIREAERAGEAVLAIWHSHPDAPATLSPQDTRHALDAEGLPVWPGAVYLVAEVRAGKVVGWKGFRVKAPVPKE